MKKTAAFLILCFTLILSACGGNNTSGGNEKGNTNASAEPAAAGSSEIQIATPSTP
ncbi:hypothetical protein [Cohnella kolymensis]|uniref:hypothetical protein n=1 Tax=Cohnella kolymensis TaxID=1590652 RepID=UPI00137923C1|nr:hypothetical protein [Cohnella kolymensis]